MAAPSYSTDLTTIHACDTTTTNTWYEPTGFGDGAITLPETDYFIQNTGCLSKNMGTGASATSGAICLNAAGGLTITAPSAVFMWIYFGAPNALATRTSGGLRFLAGSSSSVFKQYYMKGSDVYTYGGWLCLPFHPSIETGAATISVNATNGTFTRSSGDYTVNGFEAGMTIMTSGFTNAGNNTTKVISSVSTTVITVTSTTGLVTETGGGDEWVRQCDNITGSPTTTAQYFGAAAVLSGAGAVSKGNPFGIDALRYGRGESRIYNGEVGNVASFSGFATTNDSITNRWGLIQAIDGGYLMQGLVILGYSAAVYFGESNTSVLIANTDRVVSAFNTIEIRQSGSTVSMSNISFLALGTTSRGNWVTTDNATVTLSGCTFTKMGTFGFQTNTTVTSCTFRQCNLVTRGGAAITSCIFDNSNDSVKALSIADPSVSLVGCSFTKPTATNHAIEITAIGTYTFTSNTFTGYASSNGSTGDEVVYNTSGGLVTIQHSGTTGTISYRNSGISTTTVSTSVSITIKVTDESNNNLQTAYVYIIDDGSAEVMNTTTNSSGLATGSYTGAYSSGTLRVRKYGYKPYTGSVNLSTTVNTTIVLVTDAVQDASPQDLSSYFTISTGAKTVTHSSGTSTYTVKEFFKWLANTFAAASYMDDTFPMLADTATVFRFTNSWTFGDTSTDYKYLTGGAITSSDSNALWSNIYTIGTQYRNSQIYIVQNSGEITPWWSTGNIDVLILVKSSGSLIDSGLVTVLSRDSDCLYDHNIVDLSGGGRTPVGINTFTDTNYTETGDIYLQVASVTGFDAGNYAYGNTSTASGRIQYVDTTNTRLYLCQVEGTFQTSETIYERTSRTTGNTGTSTTNSASTAYTNVVAAYTDIKYAFVQRQFSGGTVSGGPFQVGETLTQSGSGWTGKFAYIDASDVLYAEHTSGTANGTGQLTGSTSGATYTPTTTASQTSVSIDLGNGNGVQPYNVIVNCAGRTIEQVYRYLKYITRHNSTATINNDGGEEYRSASPGTYSNSKQAPFGTFAGGQFFGARGIYIYNMVAADANDYQLTDANDVTQAPPITIGITIHVEDTNQNNIENARVYVYKNSDLSVIINGDLTNSSGNASGTTSADIGGITIRVRKSSSGDTRYLPVEASATVTTENINMTLSMTEDSIAET